MLVNRVLTASVITSGESVISSAIPFNSDNIKNWIGCQTYFTGTGQAKVEVHCSNDWDPVTGNGNFYLPTAVTGLVNPTVRAAGATTPGSFDLVQIPPCKAFKIKVSETGNANSISNVAVDISYTQK